MDGAPNLPKTSQWVLRRLETPVTVDAAPIFFLTSPEALTRLGSSVHMDASTYFPKSTPGVLRKSASCWVHVAPNPPEVSPRVLRRLGLL